MLFWLLSFTFSAQKVDCKLYNMSFCDSSCFIGNDNKACVSEVQENFCFNHKPYILMFIGADIGVEVILLIIGRLFLKFYPPIFSYLFDIVQVTCLVLLIDINICDDILNLGKTKTEKNIETACIVFIIFIPFIFLVWSDTWKCMKDSPEEPHKIERMMIDEEFKDYKEGLDYISSLRRSAPVLCIERYRRAIVSGKGGRSRSKKVFDATYESNYVSWEERGEAVEINNEDPKIVFFVKAILKYNTDEEQENYISNFIYQLDHENGYTHYFERVNGIQDLTSTLNYTAIAFSKSRDKNNYKDFFNTCAGKLTYVIFSFFGLRSIIESLWCIGKRVIIVNLEKYISGVDKYRAKQKEQDVEAMTYSLTVPDDSLISNADNNDTNKNDEKETNDNNDNLYYNPNDDKGESKAADDPYAD